MENLTGISKMAGRVGMLFVFLGVLLYFMGIFGAPRYLAFTGLALMISAGVAFIIEEFGPRR